MFKILFIYLFMYRVRREGRETSMWERNIDWLALVHALIGHQTFNPGMCPNWESNLLPFMLWNDAQPMEPHQSGHNANV